MPTFSAIELESLVEPRGVRDSFKKPLAFSPPRLAQGALHGRETAVPKPQTRGRHIYISPALYATPEPAPIPETVTEPPSPSPYVVNHKRRGGGSGAFGNWRGNTDGIEVPAGEEKEKEKKGADIIAAVEEEKEATEVADDKLSGDDANEFSVNKEEVAKEVEAEEDAGFLDTRCDSVSIGSENEVIRPFDSLSFMSSTHGEFFDAIEDFSSDSAASSSTPLHAPNFESELRALKLSLLEEVERRKEAEDTLNSMHRQWQRIGDLLSEYGIKLPIISRSSGDVLLEDVSVEDLSQELIVHRYVAQALGKAEGRVEAELAAETIIQSKDQEISRLRDRLQYYEAVNHEMSQRNQEIIEVTRKRRQRRKSRLFWGCMGASVTIGISALAYAYTSNYQDAPITGKATSNE